jgi:protein TonB
VAQTITPDAQPQQPYRPGPRVDPIETPTDVPDDAPAEKDPGGDFKPGGDDEYRNPGQGLPPPGPVQPPPPAPREEPKKKAAPKPKPKKPGRVTEGVTPPVAISQGAPSYPASARDQGIEGTVVVKYVVTDSGAVTDVKAVRGPPELRAVCVAAVQAWRFKPAVDENGKPIAVSRTAQFPFRIKTH